MLKPAAMQRVGVVGPREERQQVVSLLHDLGVVQIEPLSEGAAALLRADAEAAASKEVSEELLRIRSLMSALPRGAATGKRGFSSTEEVMEVSKSIKIDDEVASLKQAEERLKSKIDELKSRTTLVRNLDFIDADLGVLDLESAASFFASLPADGFAQLSNGLSSIQGVMIQSAGADPVRVVVVVPRDALEKFGSIVQAANIRLERIPPMAGTASQILDSLEAARSQAESELAKVTEGLLALSERYYGTLSSVEEQLHIEARIYEVINQFGFTESSFVMEGWVPRRSVPALRDALARHSGSTIVFDLPSDSRPPTLMETPKRLRFFESFVRFYSLPQSNEFDPTVIFAFTFPIFFGLMLGDVGYGLVILGVSLWIIKRVEHPGGKTLVPAGLRRFARNIFKPTQFRKLAMAMVPGSIMGIIFGFMFNAYFGFHFNQYLYAYLNSALKLNFPRSLTTNGAILDPISSQGLKTLLLISGYVGLFEVSLGLVMGMVNKYWEGETRHIYGKLGWLFEAWGIVLIGLTVLHHGDIDPASNPLAGGYIGLVVAGMALIAYGEGGQALIELPSIVSHILSYTRLVGILLASVALALVVDTLFLGDVASGPAYAVMGVVILVTGQLFNLVLALFEPGIQGARLIYVEFFSKFYHGQGRMFTPFRGRRTYTMGRMEMAAEGQAVRAEPIRVPV
ncbi:MAG: V-type ATP synthase subunit I [Nitrososphaerota archaeon]|nr:V-type ATP synthase subunit I [Nitrososphaerota archaeon]